MGRRRLPSRQRRLSAPSRVAQRLQEERGYLMVALLVAMSVMAIMMGAALPAWRTAAQREKEAELIFRGEQYARAIALYQRRYANASPPNLDVLVSEKFLRKKYKDPMTGDDFQPITAGSPLPGLESAPGTATPDGTRRAAEGLAGRTGGTPGGGQAGPGRQSGPGQVGGTNAGIVGVTSKSTERSFRLYNGRDVYNQWVFMGVQQSTRAGGPGGRAGLPGQGADGGQGGRDGRGGVQQPPGRGQQPAGRGQPPPTGGRGQRGFGGRLFEN